MIETPRRETTIRRLLSSPDRPVAPPDAAHELLCLARQPWSFRSLALGWMKLDILARFTLVLILGVAPVVMTYDLNGRFDSQQAQLNESSRLVTAISQQPALWTSESKVIDLGRRHAELLQVTESYRGELERVRRLQILALSLLGILVVLSAIGQYRRYIAVKRMRTAMDFFLTPSGIAWLRDNGIRRSDIPLPP